MKNHLFTKGGMLFCNVLRTMGMTIFLFLAMHVARPNQNAVSVNPVISISEDVDLSIDGVFNIIENQTEYKFLYPTDLFKNAKKATLNKGVITLDNLLKKCLYPLYGFRVEEDKQQILVYAQQQEEVIVEGTVYDEYDIALFGVTVIVDGTYTGTTTDEFGYFKIKTTRTNTLVFSYLGMEDKRVAINGSEFIDVVLKQAVNQLDAVQVTAYGATTQRLNTGNISTVKAKEIAKAPVTNVLDAIVGKTPGLFIQPTSGQAGSPINIQIRGVNTLTNGGGAGAPLILVNGVPLPSTVDEQENALSFSGDISGLNYVNPDDIESIDILKDAEATSIYGSRGANGVILITLKKGTKGAAQFNFTSRSGASFVAQFPQLLNTRDYIEFRRNALTNGGIDPDNGLNPDVDGTWSPTRNVNWAKEFFKPVLNSRQSVSYSGSSETVNYLLSANYNSQDDVQNASGSFETMGALLNLGLTNADRKFNVNVSANFNHTRNTITPTELGIIYYAPNAPDFLNPDGTVNWTDYNRVNINPGAGLVSNFNDNRVDNLIANLSLNYNFDGGVGLKFNLGYNNLASRQLSGVLSTAFAPGTPRGFGTQSSSSFNNFTSRTLIAEPMLTYNKTMGKGKFDAKLGGTFQDQYNIRYSIDGEGLLSDRTFRNPTLIADAVDEFGEPLTSVIPGNFSDGNTRYVGFFALANYNLLDRYILSLSGRYDGSTRFGPGRRFGSFWSASAGWILSEEEWFKNTFKPINYLKIRGSYGTSGGDNIGDFQFRSVYTSLFSYGRAPGFVPNVLPNPNLAWESTLKSELGVELELFQGRVSLSESYYRTFSDNLLVSRSVSSLTGSSDITLNSEAEVVNWGHEITLSTKNIVTDNFSWSTNFNITFPRSRLDAYPENENIEDTNFVVGKPITGIRLFYYRGIDPETGLATFARDIDGSGAINPDTEVDTWLFTGLNAATDRTEFIDLAPKYFGGLGNTFTYKNLDLSVFLSFNKRFVENPVSQIGAFIQNTETDSNFNEEPTNQTGYGAGNIPQYLYDNMWKSPQETGLFPIAATGALEANNIGYYTSSTGAYVNTFIARLQNISLGYTVPLNIKSISNFRVFAQAQNVLLLTDYKGGFDPEVGGFVPPVTSVVLGLNMTL